MVYTNKIYHMSEPKTIKCKKCGKNGPDGKDLAKTLEAKNHEGWCCECVNTAHFNGFKGEWAGNQERERERIFPVRTSQRISNLKEKLII